MISLFDADERDVYERAKKKGNQVEPLKHFPIEILLVNSFGIIIIILPIMT